jgi:hypothetical protein
VSDAEFSWAVLPTWRARYPRRYVAAAAVLIAVLLLAAGGAVGREWRSALVGVALGVVVGLVVGWGRSAVEVVAGRFESKGLARLRGLTSNQVLGVEVLNGWWGAQASVLPIQGRDIRLPVVSWRIWPNRDFEDQVRGLRLALGMPADPPGEPG